MHFVPEAGDYYALVNVMDDRFFIFFLWNGHYCAIDRKTGTILESGDGDDALKRYDQLVPLKLAFRQLLIRVRANHWERMSRKKTQGHEKGTSLIYEADIC